MLKPLKIPRGVANIFVLGDSTTQKINEYTKYRPDKILEQYGMESMSKEIVNNYLTNISPISCKSDVTYVIADALFNGYFVR